MARKPTTKVQQPVAAEDTPTVETPKANERARQLTMGQKKD